MFKCLSDRGPHLAQQCRAAPHSPLLRQVLCSTNLLPYLFEGCTLLSRPFADEASSAAPAGKDQPAEQQRTVRAQAKKEYYDKLKAERQTPAPSPALPSAVRAEAQEQLEGTQEEPTPEPPQPFGRATSAEDVNKLVEVKPENFSEAFPLMDRAADRPGSAALAGVAADLRDFLPKGGCKGMQDELQATNTNHILYRQTIHDLISKAKAAEAPHSQPPPDEALPDARQLSNNSASSSTNPGSRSAGAQPQWPPVRQVLLRGPLCAGKSTALAVLVAWAREHDWVVLYLPNAAQLTGGGFFPQHSSGLWDTPESAKLVLYGLACHHQAWLQRLTGPDGTTSLWDLAQRGLQETPGGDQATQMALDVISALYRQDQVPLLVAIDSYEALYLPSGYGEWMHQHYRRVIQPQELRLAAALQVLDQAAPARGFVACADGNTCKHRTSVRVGHTALTLLGLIPRVRDSRIFEVSRLDRKEWDVMLDHYMNQSVLVGDWSDGQRAMAYRLTGGNVKEVRRYDSSIFGFGGFDAMETATPEAQDDWEQEPEFVSVGP